MRREIRIPAKAFDAYVEVHGKPVQIIEDGGFVILIYEIVETVEEVVGLWSKIKKIFGKIF